MPLTTSVIRTRAAELADTVRRHRRALHRHPELGFEEHRTAAYVEEVLGGLGVAAKRVVGTGILAVVGDPGAGRCVAVRADMDALPVEEAPGRPGYRSEVPGVSHACGHDGHVAMALGLAELLAGVDDLPGCVALYFQPAEEGPGGAEPMVGAGVLEEPAPLAVLAAHVTSALPAGVIGVREGPFTGSDDTIRVRIHGQGGHAAHPHHTVDPVPVAAEVVLAVQHLVTREVDPVRPVVVTFGTINGGTRHNVVATEVTLTGTLRTLHPATRELLVRRIPEVVRGTAEVHRASASVELEHGYAVGVNDGWLVDVVRSAAADVLGHERVVELEAPSLGGEDFFAFGDSGVPVAMHRLGVANAERGIVHPAHSPDFDLDEAALPAGVAVFAEAARRILAGEAPPRPTGLVC